MINNVFLTVVYLMKKVYLILFSLFFVCQFNSAQVFQFNIISDTIVEGSPGDELVLECKLMNVSLSDIYVEIFRLENNIPLGWQTYFCADVCYGPSDDYGIGNVFATAQQPLTIHFMTDLIPSQGNLLLKVRNFFDTNEVYTQRFFADTDTITSVNENSNTQYNIFPVPCHDVINISRESKGTSLQIEIYDLRGVLLQKEFLVNDFGTIDVKGLAAGQYILKMISGREAVFDRFIKK